MKRACIILSLLALLLIACGQTGTVWTTTHTFSGNGSKQTETFAVPSDWKIIWNCDPASFNGFPYNVAIIVYNSDGSIANAGVNAMCSSSNTSDQTEVHTSGTVYLSIVSEGNWVIQVQEWK